jgi:hypothetical protein
MRFYLSVFTAGFCGYCRFQTGKAKRQTSGFRTGGKRTDIREQWPVQITVGLRGEYADVFEATQLHFSVIREFPIWKLAHLLQ